MTWQILVAISIVTYSISILLQRILLKNEKSDPIAFSIILQLLTGILIAVYAVINKSVIPNLMPYLPNLLIMIVLYSIGNILSFKALKLIEASEFTILFASKAIWTIIGAVILLGEKFYLNQWVGTGLILGSVVLVSLKSNKFKISKGELFAVLGAAIYGLAFVNDAFVLKNVDVFVYISIAFILPSLATGIFYPKSIGKIKHFFQPEELKKLFPLSILFSISAITIFAAYQVGRNAAQIAPLSQMTTILIVILGIIFLKEKSNLFKKIIGTVMSFIGVILLK